MTVLRFVFFFSSRRRHTSSLRDWSSDVCSSDLDPRRADLCAATGLGDGVLLHSLEDVEAGLVAGEERRADIADRFPLPRELPRRSTSAPTGRPRSVRARPRNVGLDAVPRHGWPPPAGAVEEPVGSSTCAGALEGSVAGSRLVLSVSVLHPEGAGRASCDYGVSAYAHGGGS